MAQDKKWWKEGTIYQIYPRSFKDSNGDGIGDLRGIIEKLDYLKSLNVDIIWLSPIFKSPNDDNGYDISDYYDIMDEFGTMQDFDELLEGVHQRGMKLVLDQVLNHSSDEHEWFKQSRSSKDNPYRDYYYWKPAKPDGSPPNNWQSVFSGSVWEWDEQTQEYYLHYFTKKQPDLNWENPKVREEIYKMLRFWLDKGVDGFRLDVIPMISKFLDFADFDQSDFHKVMNTLFTNGPKLHDYLKEMNEEAFQGYDMFSLGEGVGVTTENANLYVGKDRNELHTVYHFDHLVLGHGPGGRYDPVPFSLVDLKNVFNKWYDALGDDGWAVVCLDNHDFPRMLSRFGNDGNYWEQSAKALITMLATQRGSLCIYHGSEIGMTNVAFPSLDDYDDVECKNYFREFAEGKSEAEKAHIFEMIQKHGRDNVRTPIQWNNSRNAGFTTGKPWLKVNPNYFYVNVADQEEIPTSILNYYRKILKIRKENPTLIYGNYVSINNEDSQIYAYRRWDEEHEFLILLNMSDERATFKPTPELSDLEWRNVLVEGDVQEILYFVDYKLEPWQFAVLEKRK